MILIGVCLAFWALTCGLWGLWGPDESRYVQIAKELLTRRNWFLLTLHDQPYDQKPPLPFWMIAGMLKLSGGEVYSALVRLPSVFFATLSVIMCYLMGRKLWGARAGLIAAFVLLTSAQFMEDAPTAELNVMYTGWTTLALAIWFLRPQAEKFTWLRAACFWGAVAGAFFVKGPLAILVILSALAGEAVSLKSLRPLRCTRPLAGLLCVGALIAGWLYLQGRAAGSEFVATQVKGQTLERFLQGSHAASFWFYFPRLFTSIFVPWAIFLIPAALRFRRMGRNLPAGMGALLGWILIPFLVLTLANGKRQSYLLPLLPAMALVVGWYLSQLYAEGKTFPRLGRGVAVLVLLTGCLMVVASLVLGLNPAFWARYSLAYHALSFVLLGFLGLAVAGLGVWLWRHAGTRALFSVSLTGIMLVIGVLLFCLINPIMDPVKTTRPFSRMLDALCAEQNVTVVGAIGRGAKPEYHVYGHYRLRDYNEVSDVKRTKESLPVILVGREKDWKDLSKHTKLKGYQLAWSGDVSRDQLMVYVKK